MKPITHDIYQFKDKDDCICTASPKTLNISSLCTQLDHRYVESHSAYVQMTLKREIEVFEKVSK